MTNKVEATSNSEQMLEGLFVRATPNQYVHHLMKAKKGEGLYQNPALLTRIQEISKKLQSNCLTLKSDRGFTPAHVAVLFKNVAGLQFLKDHGALSQEVKDDEGNTPLDLAQKFHPELIPLFQDPSYDLSFLDSLFAAHFIKLPNNPFTYTATDDFGIEIKKLMLPKPYDDRDEQHKEAFLKIGLKFDHVIKNMVFFAKKLGFEVVFSKDQYCLRDSLIRVPEGVFAVKHSESTALAIDRCCSRSLYCCDSASFLTDHPFFHSKSGVAHELLPLASIDLSTFFGHPKGEVPTVHFYMEGGNHYVMTNKVGQKFILAGLDILYVALNQMRRDGVFKKLVIEECIIKDFEKKLLNADFLMQTLEEMYATGLLASGKGMEKGFVTSFEINILRDIKINQSSYHDLAKQKKFYVPLNLSSQQKTKGIKIAAEYLAQKEYTKGFVAKTFGVDYVCFVPQLDYHLDVFMCPGPKGSIFVQDYSFSVKFLEKIWDQREALSLTPLDLVHLKRYLETAQKLSRELGALNTKVKEELSKAGFYVISTPGLFYDVLPDDTNPTTFNLNFINAVTGWSSKTKTHYYLTMGAGVGDHLGAALMSSFEKFIKSYQPDIQIGFLGYDPDNVKDFSEGMRWLNRRGSQAGPHCLSFVMGS